MPPTNSFTHTRTFLADAAVPSTAYSLGSSQEGAWCVVRTDGGADQLPWEVYLLRDGSKAHLSRVSTEEGACDVLLGELGFGYLIPGIRDER